MCVVAGALQSHRGSCAGGAAAGQTPPRILQQPEARAGLLLSLHSLPHQPSGGVQEVSSSTLPEDGPHYFFPVITACLFETKPQNNAQCCLVSGAPLNWPCSFPEWWSSGLFSRSCTSSCSTALGTGLWMPPSERFVIPLLYASHIVCL